MVRKANMIAAPWIAVAASIVVAGQALGAGAAYQVDTAEVSEPGSCKVESWASSARNHDFLAAVAPACVVSMFRPIEVSAQFNRSRADEEWTTSVSPKLKANLLPSGIGQWGVAVTTNAAIDLNSGEVNAWFLTLPATLRLSNVVRINLNAGYQRDRLSSRDYLTYGAGFDWRTPDNVWTVTAEVFGQAGGIPEDTSRGLISPRWQAGLRWRPVDAFNVDLIYGRNLGGESSNWITLATIVRFKPGDR